ncbi:Ig-like domain-containing protein, partial [Microcoleus sp. AR_TQ3_B6]|uniref:Ig-like domain-containing protein n=1 Tax=Microcoleus sp. AR_TQ3_B6 TaxID=3055284 RepID=UPI002FD52376
PPTASSFSPVDNATDVGVADNLVINFSEDIQKGSGNLVIKKLSDNSVVETIPVSADNVTVSGSLLTIDPIADLAEGTDYYVKIAKRAIKDIAGNKYAGITGNSTWNFTTVVPADTTPPTASSFSPADDATGVGVGDNLAIDFSEDIQKGTGNLVIKKLSDNSVVETIPVTADNVTVSGSELTIDPIADLAEGTDYYVEIANGAIKDIAGNNYAGITENSTWNFTTVAPADTTPPTASCFSPADNATDVGVSDNLVINFSEDIQKGSGNLVIKKLSDNSVVETIPVSADNVTVSGSLLTIDPIADLAEGTDYYVKIAKRAIKDIAGNKYAGITGNSTWNFTTNGTAAINCTAGADNLTETASSDIINGLADYDTLNGGAGNDSLNGGNDPDILTGSTGADTLIFQFGQSSVSASDRVTDLAICSDKIDWLTHGGVAMNRPSLFSRAAKSAATTLQNVVTQVFTDANGGLAGNQTLGINSAALVVPTTGSIAGNYFVINDGTAGFHASNDLAIDLTGYTRTLRPLGNITDRSFFI